MQMKHLLQRPVPRRFTCLCLCLLLVISLPGFAVSVQHGADQGASKEMVLPTQTETPRSRPSIHDRRPTEIRLRVIDATTKKPLPHTALVIHSENGIVCVTAPCPTNAMEWQGQTDKHGLVVIPARILQYATTITIAYPAAAPRRKP
jgi:hypothetical protein